MACGGGGGGSSYAPGGTIGADTTGTPSVTISYRVVPTSALAATLVGDSTGVGPGRALFETASTIQTAVNAGDTATACADMRDFLDLVNAQTGKKLNSTQASELTTDADNLAAALGC